eukprot:358066-Chlamydomonas_euryale.AAC.10
MSCAHVSLLRQAVCLLRDRSFFLSQRRNRHAPPGREAYQRRHHIRKLGEGAEGSEERDGRPPYEGPGYEASTLHGQLAHECAEVGPLHQPFQSLQRVPRPLTRSHSLLRNLATSKA